MQSSPTADLPYRPPAAVVDEAGISFRHLLLALALGAVAAFAMAITLSAFLFGLLVADGGDFQTAPVNLPAALAKAQGRLILQAGVALTAVCSLAFGWYTAVRSYRASHKTLQSENRRNQLQQALRDYRESRQPPAERPSPS